MLNIPGNVLVLFRAQCANSSQFQPVFYSLVNSDSRIQYAEVDITYNRKITEMSRESSTPITAVPLLILYDNNRPYSKFNGTKNLQSIRNFINASLQSMMSSQSGYPGGAPTGSNSFYSSAGSTSGASYPQRQAPPPQAPYGGGPPEPDSHVDFEERRSRNTDEPSIYIPEEYIPHNTPWVAYQQ